MTAKVSPIECAADALCRRAQGAGLGQGADVGRTGTAPVPMTRF